MQTIQSLFTYAASTPLPVEDEITLIAQAQSGDQDAMWSLAVAYGPALRSAVNRFMKRVPVEEREGKLADAQQEAFAAFLQVIRDHDAERSPRLAGAVAFALTRALAEAAVLDVAMTIPERMLSRFYTVLREAEGDIDKAREIAEATPGFGVDTFDSIRVAVREVTSMTPGGDDEGDEGDRMLAQPIHSGVYLPHTEAEDYLWVDIAFGAVTDEEERIVRLAYGFTSDDGEPMPLREIAHRIGSTTPTVGRKKNIALDKMRESLHVTPEGQW